MIKLLNHNIAPYAALCENLASHDRCAYVSATGTGKTYVVSKYIEDHFNPTNVLVLVPSNVIKNNWTELLPGIHILTYQGIVFGTTIPDNIEAIVCDEMHHLGAEEWGRAYNELVKDFQGKVIGVSATPVRFLDHGRDMVEECFHGNYVKGLDLPEAINQGILPTFDYVAALYDLPKVVGQIIGKREITNKLTRQLDVNASQHSYAAILQQHLRPSDNKIVVFVPSISHVKEIMHLTMDLFPEANHLPVHSRLSKSAMQRNLAQFNHSEKRAFLYTVDMLSEGMHLEDISAIIMFRKTKSPTVYLQQLGRALTSNSPSERVLIFDFVANHVNLRIYKDTNDSVIQHIVREVTNPEKQIMITDYAIEDLEILERLKELMSDNWTLEEDLILQEHYNQGAGIDDCMKLLPSRSRNAVICRAGRLGLATKKMLYGKELDEDIRKYYLQPNGMKVLMEKYPDIKYQSIISRANRIGFRLKKEKKVWTKEEETFLLENQEKSLDELAEIFGVDKRQISAKRNRLGIRGRVSYAWTAEEDEILLKNEELSTLEIHEKFFPEIPCNQILYRRRKLNCVKTNVWNEAQVELFAELYQLGGSPAVLEHPEFAHMNKNSVCAAAIRYHISAPNKNIPWSEEELSAIKQFVESGKAFHKECELMQLLPNRSYNSIRAKIKQLKNAN